MQTSCDMKYGRKGVFVMSLHSNIKRRRRARIEQIINQTSPSTAPRPKRRQQAGGLSGRDDKHEGTEHRGASLGTSGGDQRPKDPEEAWKRRMAQWSEHAHSPVGSSGVTDFAEPSDRRRKGHFPALGGFSIPSVFVSLALFMMLWGLYSIERPWAVRAQQAVASVVNHSFSSEQVAAWYEEIFGGTPSWIPVFQREQNSQQSLAVLSEYLQELYPPVKGTISASFAANGQGVQVSVAEQEQVRAALAGRVIFDGYTSSGRTLIIQHPDQVRTIYGWLEDVKVAENDWVEKGEEIAGQVQGKEGETGRTLYFSVRVGDEYVDPTKVVSFD